MISWTEEELTTLTTMRQQGNSSKVIAAFLGRTRSAIMGKLFRLGLCQPKAAEANKRAISNAHKSVSVRFKPFGLASPSRRRVIVKSGLIAPLLVSIIDLQANDCRWPYGEKDFRFCGHAKAPGSSYCHMHNQLSQRRNTEERP